MRSRLEALAAHRAAGKMTPGILERLEESCARFDSLRAADDVIELIQENFAFQRAIMEAVASPRLGELMRTATELPLIYKSYTGTPPSRSSSRGTTTSRSPWPSPPGTRSGPSS